MYIFQPKIDSEGKVSEEINQPDLKTPTKWELWQNVTKGKIYHQFRSPDLSYGYFSETIYPK